MPITITNLAIRQYYLFTAIHYLLIHLLSNLKNELVLKNLTKTEKEIISLLAKGLTTMDIAKKRKRSYETINNHKRNIFNKLDIHKISELVSFAVETGLN